MQYRCTALQLYCRSMSPNYVDPSKLAFQLAPPDGYLFDIRGRRQEDPKWVYAAGIGPDRLPWQGDFIDEGRMVYIDRDGVVVEWHGPIVLTSHGCDTEPERDPTATVAPAIEFELYLDALVGRAKVPAGKESQYRNAQRGALMASQIRNTFYLPAAFANSAHVVDFGFLGSIGVEQLLQQFEDSAPDRRMRLTENGHRLFVCKLAAHFARGENLADYPRQP